MKNKDLIYSYIHYHCKFDKGRKSQSTGIQKSSRILYALHEKNLLLNLQTIFSISLIIIFIFNYIVI